MYIIHIYIYNLYLSSKILIISGKHLASSIVGGIYILSLFTICLSKALIIFPLLVLGKFFTIISTFF